MRHAARTDANQPEIVAALRGVGAFVQPLHQVGGGVPDLLVGLAGRTYLIEVKDGKKSPSDRKLTPDQIDWHAGWRGGPVYVVTCVTEAIDAVSKDKNEDPPNQASRDRRRSRSSQPGRCGSG